VQRPMITVSISNLVVFRQPLTFYPATCQNKLHKNKLYAITRDKFYVFVFQAKVLIN